MEAPVTHQKKEEVRVVRSVWSRPVTRYGFTFLIGLTCGMLILSILDPTFKESPSLTTEMKGTLYDSRSFDKMKVADVLQYESPQARLVVNARYSTGIVEMHIDISSLEMVKAVIDVDLSSFQLLSVQNLSVNDQSSVATGANIVQINNVGDNKYIVYFQNKNSLPHNIRITLSQNDAPIYQNSVQVNKE